MFTEKMVMKIVAVVLFLILSPGVGGGQEWRATQFDLDSAASPVGSGARAAGMGGAFIAVADDATAASWNPGGLIQLETPEVSIVGAFSYWVEDSSSSSHPEAAGSVTYDDLNLNYLSAVLPFRLLNRDMVVSLNLQRLYDFTRRLKYTYNQHEEIAPSVHYVTSEEVELDVDGGLSAISPAFCVQITPRLSLGATLNIWTDKFFDNGWERTYQRHGAGSMVIGGNENPFLLNTRVKDAYSELSGLNFHAGFLWSVTPMITIGGVFKSPLTAEFLHESSVFISQTYTDSPLESVYRKDDSEKVEVDFPMSYGLGVAFRFSDVLTCALDVYATEWKDFAYRDSRGAEIVSLDASNPSRRLESTYSVRVGAEYLVITEKTIIPLRLGAFYDPQPLADGGDTLGFSVGGGVVIGPVVLDAAYQYRLNKDFSGSA
ncbi:MAG: hypothetical protein GY859_30065, partial [Desulfobacterales bacterium]|nr:hypothetical protein [Desulfobacterales bacterium]